MPEPKITYVDHQEENENRTSPEMPNKKNSTKKGALFVVLFLLLALLMGILGALGTVVALSENSQLREQLGLESVNLSTTKTEKLILEESSAITDTVKKVSPAVVSIATSRDITNFWGQVYQEQGGGTGFIITNDGYIATNKHVASDEGATYTVFTADGKSYDAKVVATDPFNDLAIIKIEASGLPVVELGDSDNLAIGQWMVAIGNALGEYSNSVTVGVISATNRQVTASGGGISETLDGLLQTDAAINPGNSGGPLVNLRGQVIGINTAVAGNAENIGFAIPINSVKTAIDSITKTGSIKRPMIGIRYIPITKEIAKTNNLSVDYGAWVLSGTQRSDVAVIPGSPADKAGVVENDIILEIDGVKIDESHTLTKLIQNYNVGEEVELKILHKGDEKTVKLKLEEMK